MDPVEQKEICPLGRDPNYDPAAHTRTTVQITASPAQHSPPQARRRSFSLMQRTEGTALVIALGDGWIASCSIHLKSKHVAKGEVTCGPSPGSVTSEASRLV